jgi:hypothetical protein
MSEYTIVEMEDVAQDASSEQTSKRFLYIYTSLSIILLFSIFITIDVLDIGDQILNDQLNYIIFTSVYSELFNLAIIAYRVKPTTMRSWCIGINSVYIFCAASNIQNMKTVEDYIHDTFILIAQIILSLRVLSHMLLIEYLSK